MAAAVNAKSGALKRAAKLISGAFSADQVESAPIVASMSAAGCASE
jgi:hypothetical protein